MNPGHAVAEADAKFKKAVEHFEEELKKIRTGRAHPGMLDGVMVEAYGVQMPLIQVGTVTAPEAQLLQISPFDPGNIQSIASAIRDNPSLGLNPSDDGRVVRIPIPALTEDRRREIAKQLSGKAEDCNIAIDAYVAEISSLRAMSIEKGFERAEKIIEVLVANSPGDDQSARNQQMALETGKSLVTGEVALISNTTEEFGPSISKVKASTYGFGLGIGALLGFLIVLQLSVTDKRIRSVRKLTAVVGAEHNLGVLRVDGKDSSAQHVAAGLVHQLALHSATNVRLLSVDGETSESVVSTLTQALQGNAATVTSMNGADHLTTSELLSSPHSIVVLIADSTTSRSDDLKNVWAIAENAGNEVAGVILVQH